MSVKSKSKKSKKGKKQAVSAKPHKLPPVSRLDLEGTVSDSSQLKLRRVHRDGGFYTGLFENLAKLELGQAYIVNCPPAVPVQTLHVRITSAMRREAKRPDGLRAPKGCKFEKRTTENGNIAIVCAPELKRGMIPHVLPQCQDTHQSIR